jgi:hypothetical protein
MAHKLFANVRKGRTRNMACYHANKPDSLSIVYIAYCNEDIRLRDDYVKAALNIGLKPEHIDRCIIIAKNIDNDVPYDFISLAYKP